MKKLRKSKILVFIIIAAILLQAGYIGYSMLGESLFGGKTPIAENTAPAARNQISDEAGASVNDKASGGYSYLKDETTIEISPDILALIKKADPENYSKNIENYKTLLKQLNVHVIFKNELERLVKSGYKLPDILIAYSYLNDCYGSMTDIEPMVKARSEGGKWPDIFKEYNVKNPEFVPSNFDSDYLEKLLQNPGLDQDAIMLADRISQKAKVKFAEVINKKLEGYTWRYINAQYGIVNGQESSPHLSVTSDQLTKYANKWKLAEKQVIEGMTLASKLGKSQDYILGLVQKGQTKEEIYSLAYQEKYY